jgi:putative ABC transport system permease protein
MVCVVILAVFFKTRPGIAIRATGDNEEMVRSSSINADRTRIVGIMVANGLVALSGAMLCQQQRYADLGSGSGMLVVGLASVIIGQALFGHRGVTVGLVSAVVGSVLYRVILQAAYQIDMPSYMVKLLSALIVTVALVLPLVQEKSKEWRQRRAAQREHAE